jgi:hypothetical protein
MKKYGEYITETLAAEVKAEPKTAAARQARKMGLSYIGFGRYADKKGRIAYIVDHDRLVPYKGPEEMSKMYNKIEDDMFFIDDDGYGNPGHFAKKKNTKNSISKSDDLVKQYNQFEKINLKRSQEDRKIIQTKKKEIEQTASALVQLYQPQLYTDEEREALETYTSDGYDQINRYLYKGHDEGAMNDHDYWVNDMINKLDSAFEATTSPFKYTTYSGLSERYKAEKIKPGMDYIFRGYLSASLDFDTSIDNFTDGSNTPVVLQIEIAKGQKSIYVDGVSQNSGEKETMLPRGTKIRVVSGPHTVSSNILKGYTDDGGAQVQIFQCKIIEDK